MSAFTCITCQVSFLDPDLQRGHYKTDWHRYNLKRKVADMPPVTADNFQQRVMAQRTQLEGESKTSMHCQSCNKNFSSKNAFDNHIQSKKHQEQYAKYQKQLSSDVDKKVAEKNLKNAAIKKQNETAGEVDPGTSGASASSQSGPGLSVSRNAAVSSMEVDQEVTDSDTESWESWDGECLGVEECLFCQHTSSTMEKNIKHMMLTHSFFIPDLEYVSDLEGLMTYLGEKVGEGHICLWCNEKSRAFRTTRAVQQHMIDKCHCKMLHDGDAAFEYTDYYDYRSSYPDYDPESAAGSRTKEDKEAKDEEEEEDEVEEEMLQEDNYQLVLPSGAVIGHRSLQRYYRQKLRPDRQLVVRNPTALGRVMSHYKALGWTGTSGQVAQKKAKDQAFTRRYQARHYTRLGVKANKLQKHFRDQVFGC